MSEHVTYVAGFSSEAFAPACRCSYRCWCGYCGCQPINFEHKH